MLVNQVVRACCHGGYSQMGLSVWFDYLYFQIINKEILVG